MKKTVLFTAALFAVTAASAQTGEITSNRGENWLSQDGDWGLTFDATPLLNYAGNLFNSGNNTNVARLDNLFGNTNLPPNLNGNQIAIGVKKLMDANTAYRGQVRIGFGSHKVTTEVADLSAGAAVDAKVEDSQKDGYMAIELGAGIEKRVGSTRVVGIYGAMVNLGFGNSKTTNEYGNALTATNAGPRPTETKNGSVFGIGVNAFAGIEWFCAPKISLSGEYTWGLAMSSKGYGSTTTESFVNNSVTSTDANTGNKDNKFSIDTGVSGASIGLNFYFQ